MGGKIILNVAYNLAIFAFCMCAVWGFKNEQWLIAIGFALGIVVVIYFKMKLIKEVKQYVKTKKQ